MKKLTVNQRLTNLETRFDSIEAKIDLILASKNKPANKGKGSKTSPASAPAKRTPEERAQAFEQMKVEWGKKRDAYQPSTKLINAIKKDRCSITHKVAKTKYGFIGTKSDLDALKAKVLG